MSIIKSITIVNDDDLPKMPLSVRSMPNILTYNNQLPKGFYIAKICFSDSINILDEINTNFMYTIQIFLICKHIETSKWYTMSCWVTKEYFKNTINIIEELVELWKNNLDTFDKYTISDIIIKYLSDYFNKKNNDVLQFILKITDNYKKKIEELTNENETKFETLRNDFIAKIKNIETDYENNKTNSNDQTDDFSKKLSDLNAIITELNTSIMEKNFDIKDLSEQVIYYENELKDTKQMLNKEIENHVCRIQHLESHNDELTKDLNVFELNYHNAKQDLLETKLIVKNQQTQLEEYKEKDFVRKSIIEKLENEILKLNLINSVTDSAKFTECNRCKELSSECLLLKKENDILSDQYNKIDDENDNLFDNNQKLIKTNDELTKSCDLLHKSYQSLQKSCDSIHKLYDDLHNDNIKLYDENTKLSDENSKLSDENSKLYDENTKLSDENSKLSDKNRKLSDENRKNVNVSTELKMHVTQLNKIYLEFCQKYDKLFDKYDALTKLHDSEIKNIKENTDETINKLTNELAKLQAENSESINNYEILKRDYEKLQDDNKLSEQTIVMVQQEKFKSEKKHDQLQIEYDELQIEYDQLQIDYDQLQIEYNELKNDYDKLKDDYNNLENNYDELEYDCSNLEKECDELKKEKLTLETIISDKNKIVCELETDIADLKLMVDVRTSKIEEYTKKFLDLNEIEKKNCEQIKSIGSMLKIKEEQHNLTVETLAQTIGLLKAEIFVLNSKITELENKIKTSSVANDEYIKTINEHVETINKLQNTIENDNEKIIKLDESLKATVMLVGDLKSEIFVDEFKITELENKLKIATTMNDEHVKTIENLTVSEKSKTNLIETLKRVINNKELYIKEFESYFKSVESDYANDIAKQKQLIMEYTNEITSLNKTIQENKEKNKELSSYLSEMVVSIEEYKTSKDNEISELKQSLKIKENEDYEVVN